MSSKQEQPYPSMPQSAQPTVIINQPGTQLLIGDYPINSQCPSCRAQVTTNVAFKNGSLTWLACLGICLVGGSLGCCFIPFCIDSLKDVYHTCPSCNNLVGMKKRL